MLDAGEDSLEVNVQVVKQWSINGTWTTGQASFVRANADGASLQQLALDITGVASDASLLGNVGKITKDKLIDVTPLLKKLEEQMRDNVVMAADYGFKAAEFSRYVSFPWTLDESGINKIFGIGTPTQPYPTIDCVWMSKLIMARGVIMTLNDGEFDAMNLRADDFGVSASSGGDEKYFTVYDPAIARTALKSGDWAVFWNNSHYRDPGVHKGGMWGAENVITVGTDLYYGWGCDGSHSYAWWKNELLKAFNTGLSEFQQIVPLGVPGYDEGNDLTQPVKAGFVNVPKLAMEIFNFRTK